ncbi:hypothetical protein HDU86_001361 [Geranomyces michiganensis]|nr:hypothetical protein HDU86_001361 [Geranomyces michiganensis]
MAQVGQFFADIQFQVDLTARLQNGTNPTLKRGYLDDYYWYFYNNILSNPYVTGMTYVDMEHGKSYISFDRKDDGGFQYELMLSPPATCDICAYPGGATPAKTKLFFPVALDGTPSSTNTSYSGNYTASERSWYLSGAAAGTAVDMDDISSSQLDPKGGLVATSTGESTVYTVAGKATQVMAAQSNDTFTRYSAPVALAQTSGSSIRMEENWWYGVQTFVDQPGKATFRGNIVAGRQSTYYTGAVTAMTTHFDDFLHRAVTNSAVITIAFIIGGFASIVLFVYFLILKPLNVVKTAMVKATKFDFSDLKDRKDASDASALSEINAFQFVFRAMITSFAKALQNNKTLRGPVAVSSRVLPHASSSRGDGPGY